MKRKILFLFLVFILQITSIAESGKDLLFKVRRELNKAAPFCLDFTQQVFDGTEMITEESGTISFVDINKVKWVYTDPDDPNNKDYKIFLIDHNKYMFYEKEENQLTKGIIKDNRQKWIWQILFADSVTDKIKCNDNKRIIYIKNEDEGIDLTVYLGKNLLPKRVIQLQGVGVRYEYLFGNYKVKFNFNKEIFELKFPKDVDVVFLE